ncbi:MAG: hypothetical protein RSB96_03045 [Oscillospiraceae bacterium]
MLKKQFLSILKTYGFNGTLHHNNKKYLFLCVVQPIKIKNQDAIIQDFSTIGSLTKGWYQYFCEVSDVSKLIGLGSIITIKNQSFIVKTSEIYTLANEDIYQFGTLESAHFGESEGSYGH